MQKTEEFILKPGHTHHGFKGTGENRVRHAFVGGEKDNDRVQLTEVQAHAFRDKFESVKDQKNRLAMQAELADLQAQQAEISKKLEGTGMTIDQLIEAATTKKPDPTPSTGTAEPTPATTTPAPIGSTSDPVNAPPTGPATDTPAPESPPGNKQTPNQQPNVAPVKTK